MSGRRFGEVADGRLVAGVDAGVERLSTRLPVSTSTLAGLVALLPVVATTLYRVVHNAPGTLPADLTRVAAVALPAAVLGPAVAALLLAATAETAGEQVGLVFAGGFAPLALASPAAWVPAAVATVCGGCLVAWTRIRRLVRLGREASLDAVRQVGLVVVLTTAVVVSLAVTAGVAPATLRPLGSGLALVGVGLTPLLVGTDRPSLLVGSLAAVLTFGVATSVPYVAGAVLLVGGGVVGIPLGVVVFAVGGGVAGLTHAVYHGRTDAALGVGLLLAAGVPGTLLRALGVVVAVALLAAVGTRGGATA